MELSQYLLDLKACPDERLRAELGVSDEFPVLLKADFEQVVKLLNHSGRFLQDHDYHRLPSIVPLDVVTTIAGKGQSGFPGTGIIFSSGKETVFDISPLERFVALLYDHTGLGYTSPKESGQKEQQLRYYNLTLQFCGKDSTIFESSYPFLRNVATAIGNVGELVIQHQIPACFPFSFPRDSRDFNRIAYHSPLERKNEGPYPPLREYLR